VVTGRKEAGGFLEVPWVKERLTSLLGAPPFPGTLNLKLEDRTAREVWRRLSRSGVCVSVIPSEEGFCPASYFPVLLDGLVPAGIILPHVDDYPEDVVEIVAGERLRDLLQAEDGSEVRVTILPPEE
jgi:CTP-dependent riboflavin kinase